jgi:predicted dehydrogenase
MLRIGLVSAAMITPPAIVAPARQRDDVIITAVAARDRTRAAEFAKTHEIANVCDTYDELCSSDLVDAVYIATPPALHRGPTIAALRAGKHVLCEKPIGANAGDARAMVAVAEETGLVMMEAFHWRYHPMAALIRQVVDDDIGAVERIDASFTVGHISDDDIRFDLSLGGGALMDLGVYPVQWARFVVNNGEPSVVSAEATVRRGEIDVEMVVELAWSHGPTARLHCSMVRGVPFAASLHVVGSLGTVHVNNPLAPQLGNELVVTTSGGERRDTAPLAPTYDYQLDAFVNSVVHGAPAPTGGDDSVAMMTLIDAIYRAAGLNARPSARGQMNVRQA